MSQSVDHRVMAPAPPGAGTAGVPTLLQVGAGVARLAVAMATGSAPEGRPRGGTEEAWRALEFLSARIPAVQAALRGQGQGQAPAQGAPAAPVATAQQPSAPTPFRQPPAPAGGLGARQAPGQQHPRLAG